MAWLISETATSRAIWCCKETAAFAPVLLQGDVLEAVLHQDFLAVQGNPEVAHGVQIDLERALADDQHGPVQFLGVQTQGVADDHEGPGGQPDLLSPPSSGWP